MPSISSGVIFPYVLSLINITGAKPHAPTHLKVVIVNFPSGVVSPFLIFKISSTRANNLSEPLTKHAVPRQMLLKR